MIILQRTDRKSDRTLGTLTLPDGSEYTSLELPWRGNVNDISCIPAGIYKFMRDTVGRFQWFKLLDVPKRFNIEMHLGTKPSHTLGCILLPKECLLKMKNEFFSETDLEFVIQILD